VWGLLATEQTTQGHQSQGDPPSRPDRHSTEWGVETITDDPTSTSQQTSAKKTQPTSKPEQTATVVYIPLLSQHGSKLSKNGSGQHPHSKTGVVLFKHHRVAHV